VRRLTATLAALALLASGCGGKPSTGSPSARASADRPPDPRTEIQELLDRRAGALLAGDVAGFAATAAGPQRARDRRAARVAAGLPLRDVGLHSRDVEIDGSTARLRVLATWGVRGVRGTFVTERRLRAVRREVGWRISAAPGRRGAPPWEVGEYAAERLAHFVLLAPKGLGVDVAGLPAALEDGYQRLRDALPRARLRHRYLVVVAPTATSARRLTQDIRGVESLSAISDSAVHETGPALRVSDVVSQRLLVVWPPFMALDADGRRRVVAHELTHAVLAGETSGRTPSWLVEGMALYVSGDDRRDQVSAVLAGAAGEAGSVAATTFGLAGLSTPDAIARLGGSRQAGAYAYASAAAFTIAERHGRRALADLYDAFNDETLLGPAGRQLVDRALRRTTGEGLAALERSMRGLS
jgi:hypothetical protein